MIGKVIVKRKPAPKEPTPVPWHLIKPGHGHETEYLCVQVGKDDMYSTLEMLPADAKLIVRAVNNHERLMKKLQDMIDFMDDLKRSRDIDGDIRADVEGELYSLRRLRDSIKKPIRIKRKR